MVENGAAPGSDPAALGASAEDRARYTEFTRQQFWWLRQITVDQPHNLAVQVAFVFADHASRADGLMWLSCETAARILNVHPRSVQDCIRALVKGDHLIFVGWKRIPNTSANVKCYRWNLHDQRVQKRFDQDALGVRRSGKNFPEHKDGETRPHRKELSGANDAALETFGGGSGIIPPRDRKELSTKPSCNRQEPSSSATTPSLGSEREPSLLPLTDSDSKDEDQKLLERIARLLGQPLDRNMSKRWRADLFALRARGIDPHVYLLAAIQLALIKAAENGSDRLTPTTSLKRFEKPAAEVKANFELIGSEGVVAWLRALDKQTNAIVAARPHAATETLTIPARAAPPPAGRSEHRSRAPPPKSESICLAPHGKPITEAADELLLSPAALCDQRIGEVLDLFGKRATATAADRRWIEKGLTDLACRGLERETVPGLAFYVPAYAPPAAVDRAWRTLQRRDLAWWVDRARDHLPKAQLSPAR